MYENFVWGPRAGIIYFYSVCPGTMLPPCRLANSDTMLVDEPLVLRPQLGRPLHHSVELWCVLRCRSRRTRSRSSRAPSAVLMRTSWQLASICTATSRALRPMAPCILKPPPQAEKHMVSFRLASVHQSLQRRTLRSRAPFQLSAPRRRSRSKPLAMSESPAMS